MKEKQSRFFQGDKVWYNHTPLLRYEGIIEQVDDKEYIIRLENGWLTTDTDFTKLSRRDETEKTDAVNSPKYYNRYSVEVARRIWGDEAMKTAAEITAFIYRMRAGIKPDNPWEQDIGKEEWWLNYRAKI